MYIKLLYFTSQKYAIKQCFLSVSKNMLSKNFYVDKMFKCCFKYLLSVFAQNLKSKQKKKIILNFIIYKMSCFNFRLIKFNMSFNFYWFFIAKIRSRRKS